MSGDFLAVQLLGCSASTVLGLGSIPGWGIKVLQATRRGQRERKKKKKDHVQTKVRGIYITNKVEKGFLPLWRLYSSRCMVSHFSHVILFATLWTVVCQAPLSMGFSRQEYWIGLPCPPPGDLAGIEPMSLLPLV